MKDCNIARPVFIKPLQTIHKKRLKKSIEIVKIILSAQQLHLLLSTDILICYTSIALSAHGFILTIY